MKSLFSEDYLKKTEVDDYFSEYPENPSISDAYTMDTEDSE